MHGLDRRIVVRRRRNLVGAGLEQRRTDRVGPRRELGGGVLTPTQISADGSWSR